MAATSHPNQLPPQSTSSTATVTYLRPTWVSQFMAWRRGGAACQFILHGNIHDYVLPTSDTRPILPLVPYLYRLLSDVRMKAIFYYSLSTGIVTDHRYADPTFTERHVNLRDESGETAVERATHLLQEHRARMPNPSSSDPQQRPLAQLRLLDSILRGNEMPVAVVIDYLEKVAPHHVGEGRGTPDEMVALEILQRWASDHFLRTTQNVVVMLGENLDRVAAPLRAEHGDTRLLELQVPDVDARLRFIRRLAEPTREDRALHWQPLPTIADDFSRPDRPPTQDGRLVGLAQATKGIRLVDIDNLGRWVQARAELIAGGTLIPREGEMPGVITPQLVSQAKEEIIRVQTKGLLEVVEPYHTFDDVGGLENIKAYLKEQVDLLRDPLRYKDAMRGLILAGPPGTGKSVLAEALAKTSGHSMVKLRDIRSRWVGGSEENMTRVLDIIVALAPVVVFIDEMDQALGQRDSGSSGDSGVQGRVFARLLEFIGTNKHRGEVVWIGATNRPDLLDAAMLRRFDRVVPLLLPSTEERQAIFKVMPSQVLPPNPTPDARQAFYSSDIELAAAAATTAGLSGAAIEMIIRRAREITHGGPITNAVLQAALDDFKPNHDVRTYDLWAMIALKLANFYSALPAIPNEAPYNRLPYTTFITKYGPNPRLDDDPEKLNAAIEAYGG